MKDSRNNDNDTNYIFSLIFFCTLFSVIIVHKFIKSTLKFLIDIFLILVFLSLFYYLYTINAPVKKVYLAAFNYYSCTHKQLYENECNEFFSKLAASKFEAEISNVNTKTIDKTIKLASYEANPGLEESPYFKIKTSLEKYPLFIPAQKENFLMYDGKFCGSLNKPFYHIVGWLVDKITYNVYIAVLKENHCPQKYNINEFPIITSEQYENLQEGYWQKPSHILPYYTQKFVLVANLDFSLKDLKKLSDQNRNKNGIENLIKISESDNNNVDISDIKNLGTYGRDKIDLYKSNKSCFISIYGKNNNGDQSIIFWNPKYPEWLVFYPNMRTTEDAVKFSRLNSSKLHNEVITDYVVILGNIAYRMKGVYIDNKVVKLANFPIANLKEKLIFEDNLILHLKNFINTKQSVDDFYFGLDGFTESIKAYESLCRERLFNCVSIKLPQLQI